MAANGKRNSTLPTIVSFPKIQYLLQQITSFDIVIFSTQLTWKTFFWQINQVGKIIILCFGANRIKSCQMRCWFDLPARWHDWILPILVGWTEMMLSGRLKSPKKNWFNYCPETQPKVSRLTINTNDNQSWTRQPKDAKAATKRCESDNQNVATRQRQSDSKSSLFVAKIANNSFLTQAQ